MNYKSFLFFIFTLLFYFGCNIQYYSKREKLQMIYSDSVKNNFTQITEDHSKYDYVFPGYPGEPYYTFDFKNNITNWGSIEEQLYNFIQLGINVTDAWYKRRGSHCGETQWMIGDEIIIRLAEPDKNILNIGYKEWDGKYFSCGVNIVHYIKKDKIK